MRGGAGSDEGGTNFLLQGRQGPERNTPPPRPASLRLSILSSVPSPPCPFCHECQLCVWDKKHFWPCVRGRAAALYIHSSAPAAPPEPPAATH